MLIPALLLAVVLSGDFGNGPAKWIMTSEEQKAWRTVANEEEAKTFAELFWVRRDPTPGTFRNEFRDEFDSRVIYADQRFKEGDTRGALTERGRVLITLGFPTRMSQYAGHSTVTSAEAGGGHGLAARDIWKYESKDAQKYGMPTIEVVFIHDGLAVSGKVRRDPQRADFSSALPVAIKRAVVSPDLKEVPDWARPEAPPAAPPPSSLAKAGDDIRPAGAARLTLLNDAAALRPQSGKDPFDGLQSVDAFTRNDELGWAVEYCTGKVSEDLPGLTVQVTISGIIGGEKVNFRGEPEEMVPDSIKAAPGCYLVRGAIPLSDLDPAAYTLSVTLGRYNLTKEFKVN